jgi:ribonuclease Z
MVPLIQSLPGPPPALLVHEATDAFIPQEVDFKANRTPEVVMEKCIERGHSTPVMAGAFAKLIGAQRLILNHIGSRFPAPGGRGANIRMRILNEIVRQATVAWDSPGQQAIAATDFLKVTILPTSTDPNAMDTTGLLPVEGPPIAMVPDHQTLSRGGRGHKAGGHHHRGGRGNHGRGGAAGQDRPHGSTPYQGDRRGRGRGRGGDHSRGGGGRGGGRGIGDQFI